jgi:formylmethanofuran dehydrogenase subunit C
MLEGWRLTLRARPALPVEVGALNPEALADISTADLERMPLALGRRTLPLAELFKIEGGPGSRLVFAGDCERLDGIGRGLTSGLIVVEGDAGHETAAGQSSGQVQIAGSVRDHAAMGMRGGVLEIGGHAGAYLGTPPPGERLGLRGGLVTVGGSVGERAGDRMRRGMIFVSGVPDTFAETGRGDLTIFKLLAKRLAPAAAWLGPMLTAAPLRRLVGDLAVDGKGEILLAQS